MQSPVTNIPECDRVVFHDLQERFRDHFETVFPEPLAPRSVVVVPSLSLDTQILAKISGVTHYEERLLCLLMLLRLPKTQMVFVTSQPIDPVIIDYFLNLLPGVPVNHSRKRLTLLSCFDSSPVSLTQKILQRPRVIDRIKQAVRFPGAAHLSCFNATPLERDLAIRLNMPLYACDPELTALGSKSGSRRIFREAGVPMPDGFEDLRNLEDVTEALADLKLRNPDLRKAVVKLDEGFSGEGNAVFNFEGAPQGGGLLTWVGQQLPQRLLFEAKDETFEPYFARFDKMRGIVEAWIEGEHKVSPSVQCRINPGGVGEVISTHDQIMGGPSGQIFQGCTFPCSADYRDHIQDMGDRVTNQLANRSVLGRFSVDFISVKQATSWRHYAIEINLRKGGTTHPFMMLQFLTDGSYNRATGEYRTPNGRARYYYCTDNLESKFYRGLTAEDLIDIAVCNGLHFHGASQEGVFFHLIGALSEFGKLGVVAIGRNRHRARKLYEKTVEVLEAESRLHQEQLESESS